MGIYLVVIRTQSDNSLLIESFFCSDYLSFKASKKETVSNYDHQKTTVNCLQMELSSTVRFVLEYLHIFLDAIKGIIACIEERYKKDGLKKNRGYITRERKEKLEKSIMESMAWLS